ncbi:hypothetical protein [Chryseobacterium sp.]|uniref:hypothetical protein n=1 Tax=Chryseobacterium sp. TaxID=1871047 RepID=UPI0035C788D5
MTKQLKFAVVLLLTVASMNANAQKKAPAKATKPSTESKSSKPSKQETMDWIAGKMKENLTGYREFISYHDGIFKYKKEWKAFVFCTTSIDLNKITKMSSEYSEDFYISGKGSNTVTCDDEAKTVSYYQDISISGPNYNNYGAPFNFTPDQALVDRLKKAFATLIEYNSAKKEEGEAF